MIRLSSKPPRQFRGDTVAYLVRKTAKGPAATGEPVVDELVAAAAATGDFPGRAGQSILFYDHGQGRLPARRVLVVGLGDSAVDREGARKAAGAAAVAAAGTRAERLLLVVPDEPDLAAHEWAECLTEGLLLASYRFDRYKTREDPETPRPALKGFSLYATKPSAARRGIRLGRIAARAACKARDMANEPGNAWTPARFAEYGLALADRYGFKARVLDKAAMRRLGMGGILAVNQGSAQPPKLVILEHRPAARNPTLLLVGKGLTFDSGGISLKPSAGMEEMKYDMCGGAAVLALMEAVGEERPQGINIVAMVPATENLPGPSALKPGDVIRQYNGTTVEVINTDAEGRLILADALAYGVEKYRPEAVVDLATLTGAVIIGLGHHRTGLMANDEKLCARLLAAGERAGEPLWRLPLGPEYSKQLKSAIADLKNVGKRDAGTITAASFLREFVGDTPWAHLDIAGTAWNFTEKSYIPKGPSGIGVRTLLELVRAWQRSS